MVGCHRAGEVGLERAGRELPHLDLRPVQPLEETVLLHVGHAAAHRTWPREFCHSAGTPSSSLLQRLLEGEECGMTEWQSLSLHQVCQQGYKWGRHQNGRVSPPVRARRSAC